MPIFGLIGITIYEKGLRLESVFEGIFLILLFFMSPFLALLFEGVRIGEEQFEKELLSAPSDDFPFWGFIETRPFMRALHTLSLSLFKTDTVDGKAEAVAIWRRLHKICPNDNLGVRFLISEYEETGTVDLDADE